MAKFVVACSRLVKSTQKADKDGVVSTQNIYLNNTSVDGVRFWSNEPLSAGVAVELTARKKGDKYLKSDGTEGVVDKDGYNFEGAIGTSIAINAIKDTQAALLAMAM